MSYALRSGRTHESDKILTTFRELGVLPEICDALERAGIVTPFAIQEMTLSVALMGTDLIGQARTGTGKTLAFGIPVLQRSIAPHDPDYAEMPQGKPQALVVPRPASSRSRSPATWRWPAPTAACACSRSTAASATSRSSTRWPPASTSSSARPAASSTSPTAAPSTCPTCTHWCSTRPTRCSTSASCPTWSGSSR